MWPPRWERHRRCPAARRVNQVDESPCPEAWARFRDFPGLAGSYRLPTDSTPPVPGLLQAYSRMMEDPDVGVRSRAAAEWLAWEDAVISQEASGSPGTYSNRPDDGIPGVLIHGRNDLSGGAHTAWELARAWPGRAGPSPGQGCQPGQEPVGVRAAHPVRSEDFRTSGARSSRHWTRGWSRRPTGVWATGPNRFTAPPDRARRAGCRARMLRRHQAPSLISRASRVLSRPARMRSRPGWRRVARCPARKSPAVRGCPPWSAGL
jgi:hypothetical protein